MITVFTSNGIKFINDHNIISGSHDKEAKTFTVVVESRLPLMVIEDVEAVTFTSDSQPTELTENGSLVDKLDSELKSANGRRNYWYEIGSYLRNFVTEDLPNKCLPEQGSISVRLESMLKIVESELDKIDRREIERTKNESK